MYVNKPAGAPQDSLPLTERPHAPVAPVALTSAAASSSGSSAAARANTARSTSHQTPAPQIAQLPRHRLGAAGASSAASAPSVASPVAPGVPVRPQYPTELAVDSMGIVAQYLAQSDQLVLRGMSDPVRDVVDLSLRNLTISAQEACALLAQRKTLPKLDTLHLTHCNDADLVRVAEVLRAVPRPAMSITLDRAKGVWASAAGLRALAGATLAGLHVKGLTVAPDAAEALATSLSPVSISLPFHADGVTNVYWLTQIRTLTSLDIGKHHVSRASIAAIAAHPNLEKLEVDSLPATALQQILTSERLRSFTVLNVTGGEPEAFEAFADNRLLTSLSVGHVTRAESLMTLSRNTTLTSVDLHVNRAASVGIPYLANLPALAALDITGLGCTLTRAHVQALCAMPLASLGFHFMPIDPDAMDSIVKAPVASLSVTYGPALTDKTVGALVANKRLSELTIMGDVVNERRALQLIASATLQKLKVDFDSDVPKISEDNFKRTWIAAGKSLGNLDLTVFEIEEGDEPDVVGL